LQLTGFGGLLAGLEEAGGPEPFVDASSGHSGIFVDRLLRRWFRPSEACGRVGGRARR
jgi:hypothetical protein